MKKNLISMALALCLFTGSAPLSINAQSTAKLVPAFPGAQGAGMYATGGRGGSVYHVTNLNDSGTGSFRDAVSASNRIVVFDVGGTINLRSDVVCKGNITIAGQTAPGGKGITLKGGKFGMGGDNIIVRFISSRPGEKGTESDYDAWGGSAGSNSIIDHCALGWANDEQFGLYSNNMHQTVQYTIIGPSNCVSYHSKGAHGFGAMFGKGQNSWHHNLMCHSLSRNFRGKVEKTNAMDFVNNVIYDWGYQTAYGTLGHINYVNNYLKAGPSTSGGYRYLSISSGTAPSNYKFFLQGNTIRKPDDSVYSPTMDSNNWNGGINYGNAGLTESDYRSNTYFPVAAGNGEDVSVAPGAQTAQQAYEHVLAYSGPAVSPQDSSVSGYDYTKDPSRNKIDAQVLYETRTGTGSLTGGRDFSTVTDSAVLNAIKTYGIKQMDYNAYYPAAVTEKTIIDSDNDGMSDEWELARGLNPNDSSDAKGDYLGQGYNNIEYYINDLTVNAFPEGVVTPSPTLTDLGPDYASATEDANALKLSPSTLAKPSDLVLPTTGGLHGSAISWASASKSVTIKNNKITGILRPAEQSEKVTLVASVTQGTITVKRSLTVTLLPTSVRWAASATDAGKPAGAQLMAGLYTVSALTGNSTSVTLNDIPFTYYVSGGEDGTWSQGAASGTALRYTASENGYLSVYLTALRDNKSAYLVKAGAAAQTDAVAVIQGTDGADQAITAKVTAGETYFVYVAGSKGRFLGAAFDINPPTTLWKASGDILQGGVLMKGLTASEAMTYIPKNGVEIDGTAFTGCIQGTNNPSEFGASGAALRYAPTEDCTFTVYYKIGAGKTFQINDAAGTILVSHKNEEEASEYASTTTQLKAGAVYYAYVASSRAEFYGAAVTPSESSQDPTPPPVTPPPAPAPVSWKAAGDITPETTLLEGLFALEPMTYKNGAVIVDGEEFPGAVTGTNNPSFDETGRVTGGAALGYAPKSSGILTIYAEVGAPGSTGNKTLYISDEKGAVAAALENTSGSAAAYALSAPVSPGNTYYMYVKGSKAKLYGVAFVPSDVSSGISMAFSEEGIAITADRAFSAKLYAAGYDAEKRLNGLTMLPVTGESGTALYPINTSLYEKFMLWKDQTPLCPALEK